jgi:putative transposase
VMNRSCGFCRKLTATPVAEVAKRYGVSEPSIYAWRKRFGEMMANDVKRLKSLETESTRHQEDAGRARTGD